MNTATLERKVLQLLDQNDGTIQSTDKLIPHLAKRLKQDCHANWNIYKGALDKLERKGEVRLNYNGNVLRGMTRIQPDVPTELPTNDQEVDTMTETADQATQPDPTDADDDATPELDVSFGALPLHEQVTRALVALQLHTDDAGIVRASSSAAIIANDNRISTHRAQELNRLLGKLKLRTSKTRIGQHHINIVINQVTEEMLDELSAPAASPEVTTTSPATDDIVQEEHETLIETSPLSTPITSLAELQARFVEIVKKLEGDKSTAEAKLSESERQVTSLKEELRTLRRDTKKLVNKISGERDKAVEQLTALRQIAVQPLELEPETLDVLGRYPEGQPS